MLNSKTRLKVVFLVLATVVLASCRNGKTAPASAQGDTLRLKYATLLTIVDYDGYSVVSISNPWKEGKTLHKYVLVNGQHGEPRDNAWQQMTDVTVIHTPVERAAVFTTVHCALLVNWGCGEQIVGVADSKYIKIPWIQQHIKTGKIIDCGNGLNPVVEKIMDIRPDVIMLSPFENSGGYGKVEDIHVPLVECAEYMETSPLARAEWMKFYGRLFGRQQQADSLFAVVDSSYHALKTLAAKAGEGRSVLFDKMVGSVWYMPGGQSTIGQMAQDAGARYPWAHDEQSGSLSLPFETVLERGGDCGTWLFRYSSDHDITRAELLSEHEGYDRLQAFRTGKVYGCNVDVTPFYEETPFRPDFLLSDFIQIVHPEVSGLQPVRYYKELK